MTQRASDWAIVLAAGDGDRLRTVTVRPDGTSVPKQFWRMGARSLLQSTLVRARALVAPTRACVVVAEQHRRFWSSQLRSVPASNVVVQPLNRGTAAGLLLPLLHVVAREPGARVLVLPSDHGVAAPSVLGLTLLRALRVSDRDPGSVTLVAMSPDGADTGYGWIVPGAAAPAGVNRVAEFVEKPDAARADELHRSGAAWSTFILAGRADAFLELYRRTMPGLLAQLRRASRLGASAAGHAQDELRALYEGLQAGDFSRSVLAHPGCRDALRVIRAPSCGWSDLGTPERLARWAADAHGSLPPPARPADGGERTETRLA